MDESMSVGGCRQGVRLDSARVVRFIVEGDAWRAELAHEWKEMMEKEPEYQDDEKALRQIPVEEVETFREVVKDDIVVVRRAVSWRGGSRDRGHQRTRDDEARDGQVASEHSCLLTPLLPW
ncbi:hypothetical protein AB0C93_19790 [Streptomyces sp. NPDC048518]|uniref:hypothetical protein n=1 Tax=Streptomyces sp. NPDC048518 TaxID=3155029 RepID=UPI003406FA9A